MTNILLGLILFFMIALCIMVYAIGEKISETKK